MRRRAADEARVVKFLIHSNAPTVATGYGVQTRLLADRLAADGHEVAVSCTFGHQAGISTWRSPSGHDVLLYPSGFFTNSPDSITLHADHFFGGDPKAGWIITLLDVWCLKTHPDLHQFQVVAWTPVDHFPTPPDVSRFFANSGSIPLAMSKFGENLLALSGLDPSYVPLVVDTKVYKPTFLIDGEVTARELFGIPLDAFVVGMVAMNKDPFDRKGFNEAFRAFGQFWKNHNDAVLFVHAENTGMGGGINLMELARHCAIPEHAIVWADQYAYRIGLSAEKMAAVYTSMDVLLAPSRGEGFGVPLIEAQACGVPVIVNDFSAQSELVGAGWKVAGQAAWDEAQSSSYVTAHVFDVLAKLEQAYAADLPAMQADAIAFAAQYDADLVYDEQWRPFLATLLPPAPVERPKMKRLDVLVPLMRDANHARFWESFEATAPSGKVNVLVGEPDRSFAENCNAL
jgi:glycosyltransferase involved in cell wall biosynthesis